MSGHHASALLSVLMTLLVATRGSDRPHARPQSWDHFPIAVSDSALRDADRNEGDWLTHGRTYGETRFSPLRQISATTVKQLGLAWSFSTSQTRGHEATPLVVNGVIYTTGSWSVVYALDARTGRVLWTWDPQVEQSRGRWACCDVVNRGVAVYDGRVYVGVIDGRLAALHARTGAVVWETRTTESDTYTITGAPRVVKGQVIIGNAGAEYGVRGYVSAYDAATGSLVWRTYTVPGDPAKPFESAALARAAATWTGSWWMLGGGGTVWDSMAYDPELDLLYVGTGNGSPWNRRWRSPDGGDNLYLSSILALRPGSGEYVWHYQTTPGDSWDYTATQHIILANLTIGGRRRAVLMQAPKNGFFYVLDRATGELLSATAYAEVTWASGVDLKTGRPIEFPNARYDTPTIIKPSPLGAHNWPPMSYSPLTGLVYLPVVDRGFRYEHDPAYKAQSGPVWNTGTAGGLGGMQPAAPSSLVAWDPVAQRARWRVTHDAWRSGGTLSTAGNLVFQGTEQGQLVAYAADSGEKQWESAGGMTGPIRAAPVTYLVDGVQHVAVMADPIRGATAPPETPAYGQLLVYRLGPARPAPAQPARALGAGPTRIPVNATTAQISRGAALYGAHCARCHGPEAVAQSALPDLRLAAAEVFDQFAAIVRGGRSSEGMPSFATFTDREIFELRAYVLTRRAEVAGRR